MSIYLDTKSLQSTTPLNQVAPSFDRKKAEETFWGLGNQFWKQIIDGRFHQYGPMVFDEGLSGTKEPGFFKSMKAGCEYASQCLGEKPTVLFYKELHRRMCSHFMGKTNNTDLQAYECGEFRNKWADFDFDAKKLDKEALEHFNIVAESQISFRQDPIDPEQLQNSQQAIEKFQAKWKEKFEMINNRIKEFCVNMGFPAVTAIRQVYGGGIFDYYQISPEELERLISKLFDQYNNRIDQLNNDFQLNNNSLKETCEKKIEVLADLYQKLEWIHPFYDGQGRTDIVLLTKLACDEGLNPAILMQPYVSSWEPLEIWADYLKKGMQLWQDERQGAYHSKFKIDLPSPKIYQAGQIPPNLPSFDSLPGAETFWGLGKDFWKQIVDARWHSSNLINEERYANLFASIEAGCVFATEYLGKRLDLVFYKTLNHKLCSFDQDKAAKGGKFRDNGTGFSFSSVLISEEEHPSKDIGSYFDCAHSFQVNVMLKESFSKAKEEEFEESIKKIDEFHTNWDKRTSEINSSIQKFCSELQIPICTTLERGYGAANYTYENLGADKFEELVTILFDQYYEKMASLNSLINSDFSQEEMKNKKIEAIADLFQKLEWLNPFQHDQGITDLILLSKLLCEEGFNPPILGLVFTSSWTLLNEWKDYLKKGMKQWQELKESSRKRKWML